MKPRLKPSPRYSDVSAPDRSFLCFFTQLGTLAPIQADPFLISSTRQFEKYMDAEYVLFSQKRKAILFANNNEVSIAWLSS